MKLTQISEGTLRTVLDLDDTLTAEETKHIKMALGDLRGKRGLEQITTKEACEILNVCSMTLRRYELKGYIKPIRHSERRIRWDKDAILDFKRTGKGKA